MSGAVTLRFDCDLWCRSCADWTLLSEQFLQSKRQSVPGVLARAGGPWVEQERRQWPI